MTSVIGIDPGVNGALVILNNKRLEECRDLPILKVNGKKQLDIQTLVGWFYTYQTDDLEAFLERAQAMPGQGVSSMFNYGRMFGQLEAVLASFNVPYTLVQPAKWKRDLQVQKDKDAARARASQLLPHMADQWPLKKHDGRAEAALIAYWGQRWLAKEAA